MGQPRGVGKEGVDPKDIGTKVSPNVLSGRRGDDPNPRSVPQSIALKLRWESTLPVRLAELKSDEVEPPTMEHPGYHIAVYGIPGGDFKGDPKCPGEPPKKLGCLKARREKDVKPASARSSTGERRRCRISGSSVRGDHPKDQRIQFEAHIGRIVFHQDFELSEMEFMGKLEL
jgi:hypothetical protein